MNEIGRDSCYNFFSFYCIRFTDMDNQEHAQCVILKALSLNDLFSQLEDSLSYDTAFKTFLSLYKIERNFPDMSHFRLGPNMFETISLYVIILIDNNPINKDSKLIAHGIMTDISWNNKPSDLPEGWQGAVRKSYEDSANKLAKDTLVGLYVQVENEFKRKGWSEKIINAMKMFANNHRYHSLIIPLRLPQRFTKQYAKMAYKKFILLKNEHGQFLDHWLRLHTRLGGTILDVCLTSHQHAMNLNDFIAQFNSKKISVSGYYLSDKQGLWYNVYVDKKRQFVLINQECTWVQHSLFAFNSI